MTREELIEAMARASCRIAGWEADKIMPDGREQWWRFVPGIATSLFALEDLELIVVQAKQTNELLAALRVQYEAVGVTPELRSAYEQYRSMLSASPVQVKG